MPSDAPSEMRDLAAGRPRRIDFLLFERFSNLCLANCVEPLRAANILAGGQLYSWRFASLAGGPVHASSGLPILAEPLSRPRADGRAERTIILASYDHERHAAGPTLAQLRRLAAAGGEIVAHDAAPWLLAAAGMLDNRPATIHPDLLDDFALRFSRLDVLARPFVRDRTITTSAGAMSAFEETVDRIAAECGALLAAEIESLFLRSAPPSATRRGHAPRDGDRLVAAMLALMRQTIAEPLALDELAARLGTAPHRLRRRSHARLGMAPGHVYRRLRLATAHQLTVGTALPITEIALRCGFESPAALTRAFHARYGQSPSALRRAQRHSTIGAS